MRSARSRTRPLPVIIAALGFLAGSLGTAEAESPAQVVTFADEDRSSEIGGEAAHQRYQFSSPTTVTYDQDTIGSSGDSARVYVADVGQHVVRVLDMEGRQIGQLDEMTAQLDPASPATDIPLQAGTLLIGDGFNFVARSFSDPSGVAPDPSGRISPEFSGYWLDPDLGTRDGGLFATQHVLQVGDHVYVDSLISNRITRFDADSFNTPEF